MVAIARPPQPQPFPPPTGGGGFNNPLQGILGLLAILLITKFLDGGQGGNPFGGGGFPGGGYGPPPPSPFQFGGGGGYFI